MVKGEDLLSTYRKTERSHRKICGSCGGAVMNSHPGEGMVDVFASLILQYRFRPTMHVHYGERIIAVTDDLPKYRDLPEDFGGSGELVVDDAVPDRPR